MSKYEYISKSAKISQCKNYRYHLSRRWDTSKHKLGFLMLNPSTADYVEDDPTIRACVDFAMNLGYGGISIVNLFAYRATNPDVLNSVDDPFGRQNLKSIIVYCAKHNVSKVICAWGSKLPKLYPNAGLMLWGELKSIGVQPYALKVNKDGNPSHPLYLKRNLKPFRFKMRGAI